MSQFVNLITLGWSVQKTCGTQREVLCNPCNCRHGFSEMMQWLQIWIFSVKFHEKDNGKKICSEKNTALMNRKYIHSPIVTKCKLLVHDISAQRKHFLGALVVCMLVLAMLFRMLTHCCLNVMHWAIIVFAKHSIKHKNTSAMYSVVAKYHMFVLNYNLTDNLTLIYMLCIRFAKQEIW